MCKNRKRLGREKWRYHYVAIKSSEIHLFSSFLFVMHAQIFAKISICQLNTLARDVFGDFRCLKH